MKGAETRGYGVEGCEVEGGAVALVLRLVEWRRNRLRQQNELLFCCCCFVVRVGCNEKD